MSNEKENLKKKIIEALQTVYDPEIPVSVYELGLIYDIVISKENDVNITMTLTTPHCPEAQSIPEKIADTVLLVNGVRDVKVQITWEPPWDQDKMTEADELSTNLMFRTMHNTARVFKNSVSDQVVEIESTGTATFEDIKDLVAGQRGRVVFEEGDLEHGIWSAGISVARVKDVPSCKEMVSRLVSDAENIIDGRLQSVKA